jgi:hypothetical protein
MKIKHKNVNTKAPESHKCNEIERRYLLDIGVPVRLSIGKYIT